MKRGILAAHQLVRAALALLEEASEGAEQNSAPLWISQRTVERALGVGPRSYLEDVAGSSYASEVVKRGKLRLTRTDDYLAFLRARSVSRPAESGGAEGVLAELGLRVVPSRKAVG